MTRLLKQPRISENSSEYRFTPAEFATLRDTLFIGKGKFELIEGKVRRDMEGNPPHDATVSLVNMHMLLLLCTQYAVRCQSTLELDVSVVIPDVLIASGQLSSYAQQHPTASDVCLLVEVSDSSLDYDLGEKLALYALAKIPEYWVVDIPHQQIHVFTKPKGGKKPAYKSKVTYSDVDSVPVCNVGEVKVSEVLP
ncbi:MAG: Uma2 family endonuclease [Fimbriiglobus sp.]